MYYLDPLYGQLDISNQEADLYKTKALTRLRDVSLSAVPPFTWPGGNIASRFEHSVGVAYLAKILTKKKDFEEIKDNLSLAALFHDVGSPPFSHTTEVFQTEITGKNHEQFVEEVIKEKNLNKKIKEIGGDPETVIALINGEHSPWGDLINGSIDLDNLDNTLRWGMGAGVFQSKMYSPEEILNAFVFRNSHLALKIEYQANIQKWELARRLAYELVYSDTNLAPGSMLFRALYFAFLNDEIDVGYFYRTDSQAFYLLENKFNKTTQNLAQAARSWHFYKCAAQILEKEPNKKAKEICLSWKKRMQLADTIAKELDVNKEQVTVYAGKDKGFKKIHLPFVGEGEKQYHMPIIPLKWRIKVYLHPEILDKKEETKHILKEILG